MRILSDIRYDWNEKNYGDVAIQILMILLAPLWIVPVACVASGIDIWKRHGKMALIYVPIVITTIAILEYIIMVHIKICGFDIIC